MNGAVRSAAFGVGVEEEEAQDAENAKGGG